VIGPPPSRRHLAASPHGRTPWRPISDVELAAMLAARRDGATFAEIGRQFGRSPGAVERRLSRERRRTEKTVAVPQKPQQAVSDSLTVE